MGYGKDLLDRATAKAGSRYALSKITGIPQSDMSDVVHGRREVPASWVLKLARVAEVDPTEAMEFWDYDRAEKKRLRRLWSSSAQGGAAETSPASSSSDAKGRPGSGGKGHPGAADVRRPTHRIDWSCARLRQRSGTPTLGPRLRRHRPILGLRPAPVGARSKCLRPALVADRRKDARHGVSGTSVPTMSDRPARLC